MNRPYPLSGYRQILSPILLVLCALTLAGCAASRIDVDTTTDHTFVDVAYDDTRFNMLVRKDTIDRNDNNVLFWGVNNMFAPEYDPARQSLYFSLESNYRDERGRYYMEWNLDGRGTAGAKHRLIHGMIPKDNGYGQLLELRWNHYLFKKAFGDRAYLSIKEDGMTVNTPLLRGSQAIKVIGNTATVNWDDADIFTIDMPAQSARDYDRGQPVLLQFEGKNVNQSITLYLFTGEDELRLRWANASSGARLLWKGGAAVTNLPTHAVAEFTITRIRRSGGQDVYLVSLHGLFTA